MSEFKVGDRVKYKDSPDVIKTFRNRVATITKIADNLIYLDLDDTEGLPPPMSPRLGYRTLSSFLVKVQEEISETSEDNKACICHINVLMNLGCQCGGM